MHIIKLNATDSTNSYLRRLYLKQHIEDYTVVQSDFQTEGRGQMGTSWSSEEGKNLMFSVFRKMYCLKVEQQFYVSMTISLAVLKALKSLQIPSLSVKWPNDILSDNQKICGVLIESIIKKQQLDAAIIGIGLNVNQMDFERQLNASSLKSITGITYNLDEVRTKVMHEVRRYGTMVEEEQLDGIKNEYHQYLFRKDKPSTFKDINGTLFMGFIKGVSETGKLQVLMEDEVLKDFNLKELKLLY